MSRKRLGAATLALSAAMAAAPAAIAAGGGGGGGGSGGGGNHCMPLTMIVKLPHADGNGNTGINVQAAIRNCTTAPEALRLDVTVPGSSTVPFKFTTAGGALQPGGSLTMFASPIGSTPSALHFGQTYTVIGSLTKTGTTPIVLSRLTATVTMPSGPVA
jgi:hypothetical protein